MRRLATVVSTVLVASLISTAPGLTPAAQASYSECKKGRLCAWHEGNYEGTYNRYTNDFNDLKSNSDEWDSIRNRSKVAWLLYVNKNYKGKVKCISPGQHQSRLVNVGMRDKISSIKKMPGRHPDRCGKYEKVDSTDLV